MNLILFGSTVFIFLQKLIFDGFFLITENTNRIHMR
jgi:hypothetical protein